LVVGIDPRIRVHQVGLADAAQDAGHDVGHREIGAGDLLTAFEAALDVTEPAAGELAHLGLEVGCGVERGEVAPNLVMFRAGLLLQNLLLSPGRQEPVASNALSSAARTFSTP